MEAVSSRLDGLNGAVLRVKLRQSIDGTKAQLAERPVLSTAALPPLFARSAPRYSGTSPTIRRRTSTARPCADGGCIGFTVQPSVHGAIHQPRGSSWGTRRSVVAR